MCDRKERKKAVICFCLRNFNTFLQFSDIETMSVKSNFDCCISFSTEKLTQRDREKIKQITKQIHVGKSYCGIRENFFAQTSTMNGKNIK